MNTLRRRWDHQMLSLAAWKATQSYSDIRFTPSWSYFRLDCWDLRSVRLAGKSREEAGFGQCWILDGRIWRSERVADRGARPYRLPGDPGCYASQRDRIGLLHGIGNAAVLGLFAASVKLRLAKPHRPLTHRLRFRLPRLFFPSALLGWAANWFDRLSFSLCREIPCV